MLASNRSSEHTLEQWAHKIKWEREMSATINELLDKNSELTREIDQLKEGKRRELCNRNSELLKMCDQVRTENREICGNLRRTETLNEELGLANDKLAEEIEKIVREAENEERQPNNAAETIVAKNRQLKERLDLLLEENKRANIICNSLVGRNEATMILAENEKIMQQFN